MPCIMQAFIERPAKYEKGIDFDRRLYVVRRIFEQSSDDTYVVSLSSRTIVYKGMFLVGQLRLFFEDLQDEEFDFCNCNGTFQIQYEYCTELAESASEPLYGPQRRDQYDPW